MNILYWAPVAILVLIAGRLDGEMDKIRDSGPPPWWALYKSIWQVWLKGKCPRWLGYKPGGWFAPFFRGDAWHTAKAYMLLSWAASQAYIAYPVLRWKTLAIIPISLLIQSTGFHSTYKEVTP